MKKRFKITTLGCRTNQYESQGYKDQLLGLGYEQAGEEDTADLCIVNTCTVTKSADASSRHEVRRLLKENPDCEIVVTGCAAEQGKDLLQGISERIRLVPNSEKEALVQTLFPQEEVPEFSIKNFDAHTRAFVKVQDGCNSYCTYCIIPYVRGRSRSRKVEEILREIKELVANGYKEIVITGINVGDFLDPPYRLKDLIKECDKIPGVERLRVSSIDPDEVDEDLADVILNSKNTCPSMHIVLQSGSNLILKRMNRKYTRQIFLETVERLKKQNPDFTFTTDIIVGFPGETEEDFQQTLDVMRQVEFAKVHMFPFSPRKRTRAALYTDPVPPEVIRQRKGILLREAERLSFALREKYVGRTMSVLTETSENGSFGHTENFLPVFLPGTDLKPNTLVEVELIENQAEGLIGKQCR
jgi:threonylcarbamoyladenosine tRNA methylthiotransferase MtaB